MNSEERKYHNIAILTPTFSYFSGPDRVVKTQAEQLRDQGHAVTIFTLKAEMPPPKGVNLVTMGMPASPFLQRLYRLFFFVDVFKIKKYVRQLKNFDKIISHMYPMTILAQKAQRKYHAHYQYYNMGIAYPRLFETFLERTYMRLFLYLTKKTVQGADSAVSISDFLRKELITETGVKGTVELCTIDKRFNPTVQGDAVKKKYSLEFPTLLYVGRISPHKGIHLLIRSFKIIVEQYPQARLLIVGKHTFEDYSEKLKRLADNDPRIIFAGFVADDDLPAYYAACDVYTTATLWEGFNLPAAEAQACGKPVVAFNIGSHPEVVKKGKLVDAENVEKFAEAVVEIVKSKQ